MESALTKNAYVGKTDDKIIPKFFETLKKGETKKNGSITGLTAFRLKRISCTSSGLGESRLGCCSYGESQL